MSLQALITKTKRESSLCRKTKVEFGNEKQYYVKEADVGENIVRISFHA